MTLPQRQPAGRAGAGLLHGAASEILRLRSEVQALRRALLGESDLRADELRGRQEHWRGGYERGYVAGVDIGRGQALHEEADQRREAAGLIQAAAAGPTHAELERRRWTLRGEQRTRETFGQPHKGDYPGTGRAGLPAGDRSGAGVMR